MNQTTQTQKLADLNLLFIETRRRCAQELNVLRAEISKAADLFDLNAYSESQAVSKLAAADEAIQAAQKSLVDAGGCLFGAFSWAYNPVDEAAACRQARPEPSDTEIDD